MRPRAPRDNTSFGRPDCSFAAVAAPPTPSHPRREGYMYSEKDFASDGHADDPLWNFDADGAHYPSAAGGAVVF